MPCSPLKLGDGTTAILCGGRRAKPCFYCGRISSFLCDFPVEKYKSGKKKGEWKTCDRPLCLDCTEKGASKEVDFCREHYPLAKAAHERRIAKASEAIRTFQ